MVRQFAAVALGILMAASQACELGGVGGNVLPPFNDPTGGPSAPPSSGPPGWGWKRADSVEDALNFINGIGPNYGGQRVYAVAVADIVPHTNRSYYLFYRPEFGDPTDWQYRLTNSVEQARDFLNGTGGGGPSAIDVMFDMQSTNEIHLFYRPSSTPSASTWEVYEPSGVDELLDFLNGVTDGIRRDGPVAGLGGDEVVLLYKEGAASDYSFSWKLADSLDDAHGFLNGIGQPGGIVQKARVFMSQDGEVGILYSY